MLKPYNVRFVVKNHLCISCGICKSTCPTNAIRMVYSETEGMIYPVINEKECIECHACLEVCYGFAVGKGLVGSPQKKISTSIVGKYERLFTGFACDNEIRTISTSGGIIPALLISLLENGVINKALVVKIEPGILPHARVIIARKPSEIISSTGPKYCPVSLSDCLEKIKKSDKVAVVGLPCHIYGIRKLAEKKPTINESIKFYLGIFCGGMPTYLATKYIMRRHEIINNEIIRFEYRGGSWPGHLIIHSKHNSKIKKISIPYPKYWLGTYHYFLPFRCTVCNDGFNDFSDVSCGDLWLPDLFREGKKDYSLIVIKTQTGIKLIQDAIRRGLIEVSSISLVDTIRAQRGIENFKWFKLRSRIQLAKLLRMVLPQLDLSRTPKVTLPRLLRALDLLFGRFLASRVKLWHLFDFFIESKRKFGEISVRQSKC